MSVTFGWGCGIRVTTNLRLAQAHHSLGEYVLPAGGHVVCRHEQNTFLKRSE
jgi:hypothetical protein